MKTIKDFKDIKKDFIVENLMKSKGVYCLVARPKVGKSLLALQLANSIATGTNFIGFSTKPSPVLYISTEMNSSQLYERIKTMNLQFNDANFYLIEQEFGQTKLNLMDLQLDLQTFANEHNGKFVIVDMMTGIDLNQGYDLNNYQDVGQYLIPKFRELCYKYDFTILLVHHLNKNNTSLGSTAIDGTVDGKITLKTDQYIDNKILFKYESRDYKSLDLVLKRNNNLIFEISEVEPDDLTNAMQYFLNYAIKQKDFDFTASDMTSKLNLEMKPSVFIKQLNKYKNILEKEGLHIESKRTSKSRLYHATYEEPIYEDD